jgi:hypothetical protein
MKKIIKLINLSGVMFCGQKVYFLAVFSRKLSCER